MINKILLSVSLIFLIAACSGKKESQDQFAPPASGNETALLEEHPGKPLFKQHCSVCHQIDGSGVPGMYPPLSDSEYVQGEKEQLVKIVIQGLEGPITVKGQEYNNLMPGMPYLTDGEISNILSYVRSSFDNDASEISEEEVKGIRAELQ